MLEQELAKLEDTPRKINAKRTLEIFHGARVNKDLLRLTDTQGTGKEELRKRRRRYINELVELCYRQEIDLYMLVQQCVAASFRRIVRRF